MWRNVRGCPPPRCRSHSAARTRSSPPPANGCSRPRVSLITSPRPTPVVWPAARPERWGCTPSTCSSNGRRAAIWRISPPRTSSSVRMCWCTRCMPTRCNAASRWNAGIAARPCCWARRSRSGTMARLPISPAGWTVWLCSRTAARMTCRWRGCAAASRWCASARPMASCRRPT